MDEPPSFSPGHPEEESKSEQLTINVTDDSSQGVVGGSAAPARILFGDANQQRRTSNKPKGNTVCVPGWDPMAVVVSGVEVGPAKIFHVDKGEVRFDASLVDTKKLNKCFDFDLDGVYSTDKSQVLDTCVHPLVEAMVSEGINGCICISGQTNARKENLVFGDMRFDTGIIPDAINGVFRTIHQDSESQYQVKVSLLEINNEQIYDLYDDGASNNDDVGLMDESNDKEQKSTRPALAVRESHDLGFFVSGAREKTVSCLKDAEVHRLAEAFALRAKKSHFMAVLHIARRSAYSSTNHEGKFVTTTEIVCSQLKLVVLCGFDAQPDDVLMQTGPQSPLNGTRFAMQQQQKDWSRKKKRSSAAVKAARKSLVAVEKMFQSLHTHHIHVPFRDSVVTKLLRNCVGPENVALFVGCVSSDRADVRNTLAQLRYCDRIKCPVSKAPPIQNAVGKSPQPNAAPHTTLALGEQVHTGAKASASNEEKHLKEIELLRAQLKATRSQVHELVTKNKRLSAHLGASEVRTRESDDKVGALSEKVTELKMEGANHKAQITRFYEQISKANKSLEASRQDNAKLRGKLASATAEIAKVQADANAQMEMYRRISATPPYHLTMRHREAKNFEVGDNCFNFAIDYVTLADPRKYELRNCHILVGVCNSYGVMVAPQQRTDPPIKHSDLSIQFDQQFTMAAPEDMSSLQGKYMFFVFRHWKAKKKKFSTRCFARLNMAKISTNGTSKQTHSLQLYKKPTDYQFKKVSKMASKYHILVALRVPKMYTDESVRSKMLARAIQNQTTDNSTPEQTNVDTTDEKEAKEASVGDDGAGGEDVDGDEFDQLTSDGLRGGDGEPDSSEVEHSD